MVSKFASRPTFSSSPRQFSVPVKSLFLIKIINYPNGPQRFSVHSDDSIKLVTKQSYSTLFSVAYINKALQIKRVTIKFSFTELVRLFVRRLAELLTRHLYLNREAKREWVVKKVHKFVPHWCACRFW
jgi:hypothetical protein